MLCNPHETKIWPRLGWLPVFSQISTKINTLNNDELERINLDADDKHLEWLKNVLPNLSKIRRDLLLAHLVDGLSVKQLASMMQIAPSLVHRMLKTSIELLKKWAELDGLQLSLHC